MQPLQEGHFGPGYDYRVGSPHLKHWRLFDRLVSLLHQEVTALSTRGLPLTVLEVGAGHGGYTEPALAFGCSVTATEMSRPSLVHLAERYRFNRSFTGLFDPDGSLDVLGDQRFSFVVCSSVLHHIPDYTGFLHSVLKHLAPGGSLLTIQDPLSYDNVRRVDLFLTRISYFSWRLSKGDYAQGVRTRLRRLRREYDERNPSDMVEYHVIRAGVDHNRVLAVLAPLFQTAYLMSYWSTQSAVGQRMGELMGLQNTFCILARGFGEN